MFPWKNTIHKPSILKLFTLLLIMFLVFGCTGCQSLLAVELKSKTEANEADTTIAEVTSQSTETTFCQSENTGDYSKSAKTESETIIDKSSAEDSANTKIVTSIGSEASNLSNGNLSGNLKIHYIDVGQGDGIFIELPNDQTILIDAGEKTNGNQIVNYIKALDYNSIDYAIATHPHADHIGGMTAVINNLNIGKFYMPDIEHTTKTFENMIDALISNNVDVYIAQAGVDIVNINGLQARFLSPMGNYGSNLNNWSAVVKLNFGQNSFLFMGDAESQVENNLSDVKADVLKVGHHGSSSSSGLSFLKKVVPKYAIISVGAKNSYGHPAEETINNLTAIGCEIYRTDLSGTIIITSNGADISINKNPDSGSIAPVTIKKTESKETSSNITTTTTTTTTTNKSTVTSTTTAPTEEQKGDVVYLTNTGTKYHREGCRYLNTSKIEISKSEAIAQGYEPCKVCKP